MELSSEVYDLLERYKTLPKHNGDSCSRDRPEKAAGCETKREDEILHLEEICFADDETWLYGTPKRTAAGKDLRSWLYSETDEPSEEDFTPPALNPLAHLGKSSPSRYIDSRTYTRPKKRYSRPSIEKYTEFDLNASESNTSLVAAKLQELELHQDDGSDTSHLTPLSFDLSQPTSTSIFERILADAPGLDSFQNMSPPSLVNSMCSSTFTTLMESSYIKNDPILREIRDTDYSETVLLQDSDPPMFQSISDSCTSLSSDKTESFIKKVLKSACEDLEEEREEEARGMLGRVDEGEVEGVKSVKECDSGSSLSCRISSDSRSDAASEDLANDLNSATPGKTEETPYHEENAAMIATPPSNFNGTYRKNSKLITTTRSIMNLSTDSLDNGHAQRTSTFCKNLQDTGLNNTFSLEKRMSYQANQALNETYNQDFGGALKRNSTGYSGGSADSLDRMSSLSNASSRGSSRMLNMSEVDAIIERQEQSLQVMSTPKPASSGRKLCDTLLLSPIVNALERSDSDLSSSDDYATGRTSLSQTSPANSDSGALNYTGSTGRIIKSVKSANAILQMNNKSTRNVRTLQPAGSYTSLQKVGANLKGSYTNLQGVGANLRGSQSNLKTVAPQLRGSYTSLKPVNKNLPEAPPPLHPARVRSSQGEVGRTVKLTRNETFKVPLPVGDIKSLPVVDPVAPKPFGKGGNLPRPVSTGIPRPVSRIPAPRVIKSATSQPSLKQVRQVKEGNYY